MVIAEDMGQLLSILCPGVLSVGVKIKYRGQISDSGQVKSWAKLSEKELRSDLPLRRQDPGGG